MREINYGRPLYNLVKKSLEYPNGREVAWNIEEREARGLVKRFGKKMSSVGYFELHKNGAIGGIANAKDYFDFDTRITIDGMQYVQETYCPTWKHSA